MYRLTLCIFLLTLFSCSGSEYVDQESFSSKQKEEIEKLSQKLIEGIKFKDQKTINDHWSNTGFLKRVITISKTEQSLLNHIFEKELKQTIKVDNITLIHQINDLNADVSFQNLTHNNDYSELILLLNFNGLYNFYIFRIEYINNKPFITDYSQIKDNLWYSERISKILNVNVKFDAFSEERHQATIYFNLAQKYLADKDTLNALSALHKIPAAHQEIGLSALKINLALNLGDSIYSNVLATEYEKNRNLHIRYLYHLYFNDTTQLNKVYEDLFNIVGTSKPLDSLINHGGYWF